MNLNFCWPSHFSSVIFFTNSSFLFPYKIVSLSSSCSSYWCYIKRCCSCWCCFCSHSHFSSTPTSISIFSLWQSAPDPTSLGKNRCQKFCKKVFSSGFSSGHILLTNSKAQHKTKLFPQSALAARAQRSFSPPTEGRTSFFFSLFFSFFECLADSWNSLVLTVSKPFNISTFAFGAGSSKLLLIYKLDYNSHKTLFNKKEIQNSFNKKD